jgi:hypothetical protein
MRPVRPSPAMLVALLALFVALGGTGYAALKLPKNSVGSKQIKSNAVTSPKVKARSLRLSDFNAAARAGLRGSQGPQGLGGPQGPKGDTGAAATTLFAYVTNNCSTLGKASGAISLRTAGGSSQINGLCIVRFNRDVSACVPIATLQGNSTVGEIATRALPDGSFTMIDANEIIVGIRDSTGSTLITLPFYLAVFCS